MPAGDDAPELSLVAALLLIAIDPKTGRLVKRRRRRFRKALAGAHRGGAPRRAAVRELRRRGMIARSPVPGHYPIVSGSGATVPFGRVRLGIEKGFVRQREIELCLLLAWAGVLQNRLTRSERRTMGKRLRLLLLDPEKAGAQHHEIPAVADALGRIAFDEQMDIVQEAVGDLLSGDAVTFDVGGGGGGGDGGGGGGGDGGGGGGGGD